MNVSELLDLTNWIDANIREPDLVSKYSALQSAMQAYAQPNQRGQSFESQREDLIEFIRDIPCYSLTKHQLDFLSSIGIGHYIGAQGVDYIEELLYKNVIDVADSAAKVAEIVKSIGQGLTRSEQIQAGLDECVEIEEYESSGDVLIRVTFTGEAGFRNVSDFKNWGKVWYEIGRGIALAHGKTPEDIRVVGATKGSIVVELAALATIAGTTSYIIMEGLKVAEKVLDIRKKAEELKGLKLKNAGLAQQLDECADEEKAEAVDRITASSVDELKINQKTEGDKVSALKKSVELLLDFVEHGGEVDFVLHEEDESEEETDSEFVEDLKALRSNFSEIRYLENRIKALEDSSREKSNKSGDDNSE